VRGGFGGDDISHGVGGCLCIAPVIDEFGRKTDCRGEGVPEMLLKGAAGDDLAVARRVELIACRTAIVTELTRLRIAAGRMIGGERIPGEGEHRVGHGDVDIGPLAVFSRPSNARRMFVTAGNVPPPMSAMSAGGTVGRSIGPGASESRPVAPI
jgi:hypothetical protein